VSHSIGPQFSSTVAAAVDGEEALASVVPVAEM